MSTVVGIFQPLTVKAEGEIEIDTCEELQAIDEDLEASYVLTDDIDCSETSTWNGDPEVPETYYGFSPIGAEPDVDFTGTLDGNGFEIINLYINLPDNQSVGLIQELGRGGVVRDLVLVNVDVTGAYDVGALVGEVDEGLVEDCTASGGNVRGAEGIESSSVGGLIGELDGGRVYSSSSSATVNGEDSYDVGGLIGSAYGRSIVADSEVSGNVLGYGVVGGLIGYNEGIVYQSRVTNEDVTGESDTGGLVGENEYPGSILESYASTSVHGSSGAGGLVGINSGQVVNSYSMGTVQGDGNGLGGLAGRNSNGLILRSYAIGDVSGDGDRVGGLTGGNGGHIIDSYATGAVTGSDDVGGLSGRNGGFVLRSFATGAVTSGADVGGLVGYNDNGNGEVIGSFWNIDSTGQEDSAGGTGLSSEDMSTQTPFNDANWDFDYVWAVGESPHPFLQLVPLYSDGLGSSDEPFRITTCRDLQNVAYASTASFLQTGDIDCAETQNWNLTEVDRSFVNFGGGEETVFSVEVAEVVEGSVVVWVDDNVQDPADYTYDYEANTITFDVAPVGDIWISYMVYSGFEPIGDFAEFQGVYDGDESSIDNLYINQTNREDIGLFGSVVDAEIKNVVLENAKLLSEDELGLLVGEAEESLIENSHSSGEVWVIGGGSGAGGLVGNSDDSRIVSSSSSATVYGTEYHEDIGGLVGDNNGAISDSHATGDVYGGSRVGGLVGESSGPIQDSYAEGNVTGYYDIGGFAGNLEDNTTRSYSTGSVTALANSGEEGDSQGAGGFVGDNEGFITKSYATGDVLGIADVGGFVGQNFETISDSYARGDVTAEGANAGGFVGINLSNIETSYSTGSVDGEEAAGGFAGFNDGNEIVGSFWDTQTSGLSESDGGQGKTTAQMKSQATFDAEEWDFTYIWALNGEANDGYPHFDFKYISGNVLVVMSYWDGGDQNREYLNRANFDSYTTITTTEFAEATPDFYDDYDIVIYEPNSTYHDLRVGLPALAEAMEEKPMVVSLRVAGEEDQPNVDFLSTDYKYGPSSEETFADDDHPMLTGQGIDGVELTPANFENWGFTDHGWLEDLPEDQPRFNVILANQDGPSWIEYGYEKGHVLVDTLTSVDGWWGDGNADVAENYAKYLSYMFDEVSANDTDTDGDGLSDLVEANGPNNGDANNDGEQDNTQPNVASFVNGVNGKYAVLALTGECSIDTIDATAETENESQDSGYSYPAGFVSFVADCGVLGFTTQASLYQYGMSADGLVVRKYNPETNAYFTVSPVALSTATIGGQTVAIGTYSITDGGSLDTDNEVNGIIVDPVGLGASAVGAPNTGLKREE